jgi:tetratricopeptide (TPR) repeat protein
LGNAAVALAEVGDTVQAEKLAAQLDRSYPSDTMIKYAHLPAIKALVLLHKNDAAGAIAALESARKYDLAFAGSSAAYLVLFVRGQAYLEAKDGAKAAGEFQKILDHNGVNSVSVFLPLAQLNLARAYVLEDDHTKARTAYQDFFAIWKDADPDIPVLIAAKTEYGKLQ